MNARSNPPMVLCAVDSGQSRVNRPFTERFGVSGEEFGARPLCEWIHPDDREPLRQVMDAGKGEANARVETHRGEWVPFTWRVKTHEGHAVLLGLPHLEGGDGIEPPATTRQPGDRSLAGALEAMARIVEAKNPGMKCSILLVEDGHVTVGAGPSFPAEYNAAIEGLRIGPGVGSCGTAAYWGVPVVVENIAEDPLWCDLRAAAATANVSACWSHPIAATDGEIIGAMALYSVEPSAPTQPQMDGLEIAARMVGLSVERERLEDQLRQATKMEAIGVLAGGVAHDFNNLLAVVLGNAELALKAMPEDSKAAGMLKTIATASLTAKGLCEQMLAYAGRGVFSVETLEVNGLARDLGGLLHTTLSKKAVLTYELLEAPLYVLADRSQLEQVIMNLTTNAAEAIGDREGEVVIGVSARSYSREELGLLEPKAQLEAGDYVRIWVRDTGTGMSPSTQAKIFDPFFTTKPAGSGLGLAAVQGIVKSHKGAITVKTEEGLGTTFTLLLPRVRTRESGSGLADDGPERMAGRILVVDDEPLVRDVVVSMLENAGYNVLSASDGQEALDVFRRDFESIDCVLLDLNMPKMNGEEVFNELRKVRKDVRVVLSSGFTEQEVMNRFKGAGIAGVLKKPAKQRTLLEKIAGALKPTLAGDPTR